MVDVDRMLNKVVVNTIMITRKRYAIRYIRLYRHSYLGTT